jgi:Tol biopolymer transport system component
MQMHFRQYQGGTLIMQGDTVKKINLKTKETCSPGVYPAWHPTENLVAYSVNTTGQVFYTKDVQKVEVLDYASDLVLYNPSNESITYIANDSNTFESFPAWNPSGTIVYYAAAHYTQQTDDIDNELAKNYSMLKYNILAKSYNKQSLDFGSADTIFNAAVLGKSATWPRISPDGRYLLFTLGDYGNFHIWHTSSDLYIKDLVTRTVAPLTQINSQQSDSYHTWSSNGRWIVFSSRRDDGNYTRLYMAYFDEKGNAYKPFKLPQAKKNADLDCYQSYNVPEFIINPVQRSKHTMIKALRKDALPVTMNQQ